MIERRKKGPLRVSMELKAEFVDAELIAILESFSFVVWAELGLQSTDAQVLSKCGRPWDAEKTKEALRLLDASSIRYKIDLMYGLPGDTFFKFLSSAAFILAPPAGRRHRRTTPDPHTPTWPM
jgi:coproporphyrinogen III oxidase-like Fe-S oxidoreductase